MPQKGTQIEETIMNERGSKSSLSSQASSSGPLPLVSTTIAQSQVVSPSNKDPGGCPKLDGNQKFPRLAFALRISDNFKPDDDIRDLFVEWLRNIPLIASEVKIEAGFDSFSTLLIISLPVSISAYLPHDPYLMSLGPIVSGNRISYFDTKDSKAHEVRTNPVSNINEKVPRGIYPTPPGSKTMSKASDPRENKISGAIEPIEISDTKSPKRMAVKLGPIFNLTDESQSSDNQERALDSEQALANQQRAKALDNESNSRQDYQLQLQWLERVNDDRLAKNGLDQTDRKALFLPRGEGTQTNSYSLGPALLGKEKENSEKYKLTQKNFYGGPSDLSQRAPIPGSTTLRFDKPKPVLKVQIPDNEGFLPVEVQSSPHQSPSKAYVQENSKFGTESRVTMSPPSPSVSALMSVGADGPPNPFSRPHHLHAQTTQATAHAFGEQTEVPENAIDTPVSELPSRFLDNDFLPSPSSFYPANWNPTNDDTSNTLPSPLNFDTPVIGTGPSFLRENAGNGKRKWDEASGGWRDVEEGVGSHRRPKI